MVSILPKGRIARSEAKWFYFFVAPWILGFICFTGGPILGSLYISFTKFDAANPPQWIGLDNYTRLFQDDLFYKSLEVSALYTLLAVPLGILLALALAVVLNQNVPFLGFFRTIYYIPSLISGGIAVALLFQFLLNPSFGIVNYVIAKLVGINGLIPLGIKGPGWFFDPKTTVISFVVLSLWGFGSSMIVYLAALQGVPTALYEAATIDGANGWQKFRNVTLPMISPVILFTFVTGVIASFQIFAPAYIITGRTGKPANAGLFYVLYLFLNAFSRFRFGYAAAQAWILLIIILVLTYFMLRASRSMVHYESNDDKNL